MVARWAHNPGLLRVRIPSPHPLISKEKIMAKLIVELEWDGDNLGPCWMNIDNLKSCLYGETSTLETLCKAREIPQDQLDRGEDDGCA